MSAEIGKTPKRREQKRAAQLRYQISDKAALAQFRRWARSQKKVVQITDADVLAMRQQPCHKCDGPIERTGVCFTLIAPRGPLDMTNVKPTCGICKMIKPVASFDPIAHSKATLRRAWKRNPNATLAKRKANRAVGRYECAHCKNLFSEKSMELDHIIPIVDPMIGFTTLDEWARRLFCDASNLQYLCKPCHQVKTVHENAQRTQARKETQNECEASKRPTPSDNKRTPSGGSRKRAVRSAA